MGGAYCLCDVVKRILRMYKKAVYLSLNRVIYTHCDLSSDERSTNLTIFFLSHYIKFEIIYKAAKN